MSKKNHKLKSSKILTKQKKLSKNDKSQNQLLDFENEINPSQRKRNKKKVI